VSVPPADRICVVKIGGGLSAIPGALNLVCAAVGEAAKRYRLLIVPGGGPFADGVREFQTGIGVSEETAHWMALLAMDQYAYVLAERIRGCVLLEEPGLIPATLRAGNPVVLAPARWMRHADVLPHGWDVTSDSIAAFVAGALDAKGLLLIKPSAQRAGVDGYFESALPAGMPWQAVGADQMHELSAVLNGLIAGDERESLDCSAFERDAR
jgi:5-(aminomethyl)-3-furanmethanol phosphate kinase